MRSIACYFLEKVPLRVRRSGTHGWPNKHKWQGQGNPPFFVSSGCEPASIRLFAWALRRLRLALSAAARRAGRETGLVGLSGGLAMADAMGRDTLGQGP